MENSPFLYSSRRVSLPWFIVFEFKLARVVSYPSLDEWIIKRSTSAIGTFFSRPSEEKPRSNRRKNTRARGSQCQAKLLAEKMRSVAVALASSRRVRNCAAQQCNFKLPLP